VYVSGPGGGRGRRAQSASFTSASRTQPVRRTALVVIDSGSETGDSAATVPLSLRSQQSTCPGGPAQVDPRARPAVPIDAAAPAVPTVRYRPCSSSAVGPGSGTALGRPAKKHSGVRKEVLVERDPPCDQATGFHPTGAVAADQDHGCRSISTRGPVTRGVDRDQRVV
jgi:hypothetical protein